MSFEKIAEQDNVLDGTVLLFDVVPGEGAYLTVAGRGERPSIVAVDVTDLQTIAAQVLPRVDGRIPVKSDGDCQRVTAAGLERLPKVLGFS
ncbi:hypothetical protein [Prescottella equi]|uniref:hypothetical protein n=1 Tax=Rhodococcus hoagii TaxID=43767 RepID=UPI0007CD739E|nr:hypothetical protein [Prescottella equi]ORL01546.1 hypothetical protein A6F56_04295 [Prescottella equi]